MKNKKYVLGKIALSLLLIGSYNAKADVPSPAASVSAPQPALLAAAPVQAPQPAALTAQAPLAATPAAVKAPEMAPAPTDAAPPGMDMSAASFDTPPMANMANANMSMQDASFNDTGMTAEPAAMAPGNSASIAALTETLDKVVKYLASKDPTFSAAPEVKPSAFEPSAGSEGSGAENTTQPTDLPPAPMTPPEAAPQNPVTPPNGPIPNSSPTPQAPAPAPVAPQPGK